MLFKTEKDREMATMKKLQKIDSEGLEELRKSLICFSCEEPPRPDSMIFRCVRDGLTHNLVICENCKNYNEPTRHGNQKWCDFQHDEILTRFVGLFKFWNCIFFKNGCQKELKANQLKTHEEICTFRNVECPMLDCDDYIVFGEIMDHFQSTHADLQSIQEVVKVLKFKGSLKDLKKSVFVLNCYGKHFFPQFHVADRNLLHFWVVGHGDRKEFESFEVQVKFQNNWAGNPMTFDINDSVYGIEVHKYLLTTGKDGCVIPLYKIEKGGIEFEMEVVSEKLDEVARDLELSDESGVEDSDQTEKK